MTLEERHRKGPAGPKLHPPKQDRSARTLSRIVEASLELMEQVGVEGATVADIVDRAGASIGSFYARFPSKEDLVGYLQERVWSDARERWDTALEAADWRQLPLDSVVEGVTGLLVSSFRADFRRRRVLGSRPRQDERGRLRMLEFHDHILESVTPLFLSHLAEITHSQPEQAIRLGYRFAVGAIREVLEVEAVGGEVDGAGDPGILIPEVARVWKAYLGSVAAEEVPPDTKEVDFFDPWG